MPQGDDPARGYTLDAEVGQFFFAAAHEMGHATFDQLGMPLFGRQEDDADQFANYTMLQFSKADARCLIAGRCGSSSRWTWTPRS